MRFDLSVWELVRLAWRRRWRFVAFAAVPILAAIAFCAVTPAKYDASAALIVAAGHAASLEPAADRIVNLTRQDRIVNAKVAILDSEYVIRRTIEDIGPAILYPELSARLLGALVEQVFLLGQPFFLRGAPAAAAEIGQRQELIDAAFILARRALRIESKPNSDIVRIVFRHGDPDLAARFANRHAENFIQRDLALGGMQSAATFLREQQAKHIATLRETAAALSGFAKTHQIYAVEEQRRLTLRRHSELAGAMAATRSAAAEKEEQVRSIAAQLALMKPISGIPEVARLSNAAATATPSPPATGKPPLATQPRDRDVAGSEMLTRDPPLLLVRVYQDTIQGLVRANSELAGIKAVEENQAREIARTEAELIELGEKEAEFLRLQAAVAQARENAEAYARKSAMQQVEADMSARNLSSIVIAQPASPPVEAAFPNVVLILLLGTASGILLGLTAVLAPAWAPRRQSAPADPPVLAWPTARRDALGGVAHIAPARRAGRAG